MTDKTEHLQKLRGCCFRPGSWPLSPRFTSHIVFLFAGAFADASSLKISSRSPAASPASDARRLGRMPSVAQRALYRDRICRKSLGISISDAEEEWSNVDGLTRGNWEMRYKRCLMWFIVRLDSSSENRRMLEMS